MANRQDICHQLTPDDHPRRLREIDVLIEQLDPAGGGAGRAVSGERDILWHAAYDALCSAAEHFAADCNDLWRGRIALADLRIALVRVQERVDLLESVGPQPDAR